MAVDATDDEVDRVEDSIRALRWFFGVVRRPQTYRNIAYLLLAFPLGVAYFVSFAVGFSLGVGLSIIGVGVLILAFMVVFGLTVAGLERRLANGLVGTAIEGRTTSPGRGWVDRSKSVLLDRRTWSALLYPPAKFFLGLVSVVVLFTGIPTAIALMTVPLYYERPGLYVGVVSERAPEIHETIYLGWNYLLVGVEAAFTFGYWEVDTFGAALVVAAIGVLGLFVTVHVCNGLVRLWARYAHWSLNGSVDIIGAVFDGESAE